MSKKCNIDRKANRVMRHTRFLNRLKREQNTKPRLIVTKTNGHIYAQVLDQDGKVLAYCSTLQLKLKGDIKSATTIGEKIASLAIAKKVKEVVFDRNGQKFHGIVKAVADTARKGGLNF
jgi:large subunit ribosomal protein L18